MPHEKFDVAKLEKLNDPARFDQLDPDRMWAALDTAAPSVIVEIGAGTGMFAARFAELAPGATVYAVDNEATMVEWITSNRPEVATGQIVPVLSTESSVPLGNGIADAIVMINVHHELADPDGTYREALRLLRPGGKTLVADWAPIDTPGGPPQHVRASEETLATTLMCAGFCNVVVHEPLPWHSLVTACKPDPRSSVAECECD